ncbi:hypothetical protein CEUSTIGMA_g3335.t1 [Chlamydomonas eustigma]|uniref:Fido domain-containing protein n=1 Tax=Chlamydomonas eustigma TaxID=1157962 RepID=A0A250WZ49_9CHLO|nr:hypothetical protein CEUSTIGMA_g3335.t1 [Chlamydomonas eustigma]|eukprot:GAX75892.1 hypothetical protein CEUSTIGMA_g3335.t1 [Chlamydomonas eustigma]
MFKTAHKLLMAVATSPDGTIFVNGEYRKTPAHSGTGYSYPPASTISDKVLAVYVSEFNENIQDGVEGPVAAAKLMYRMVTLHPFEDGNGRKENGQALNEAFEFGLDVIVMEGMANGRLLPLHDQSFSSPHILSEMASSRMTLVWMP